MTEAVDMADEIIPSGRHLRAGRRIAGIASDLAATHSQAALRSWHETTENLGLDGIDPPMWWQQWHEIHETTVGIPPASGPSSASLEMCGDDEDAYEHLAAFQVEYGPLWDRLVKDGVNGETADAEWDQRAERAKELLEANSALVAVLAAKRGADLSRRALHKTVAVARDHGIGAPALAKYLGVSHSTVYRWEESGRRPVD